MSKASRWDTPFAKIVLIANIFLHIDLTIPFFPFPFTCKLVHKTAKQFMNFLQQVSVNWQQLCTIRWLAEYRKTQQKRMCQNWDSFNLLKPHVIVFHHVVPTVQNFYTTSAAATSTTDQIYENGLPLFFIVLAAHVTIQSSNSLMELVMFFMMGWSSPVKVLNRELYD